MHLAQQSSVWAIKTSFQPETQYTKLSHLLPRNESGTRLLNLHLTFPNWIKGSLFLSCKSITKDASSWAALCSQMHRCSTNVYALCGGVFNAWEREETHFLPTGILQPRDHPQRHWLQPSSFSFWTCAQPLRRKTYYSTSLLPDLGANPIRCCSLAAKNGRLTN